MNAEQLKRLLDQRFDTLQKLLQQSEEQTDCIEQNRMTDLMQVLSKRQRMIETLSENSQQLSLAVQDDPEQRVWTSNAERQTYRDRQDECDRMHQSLLAIEAKCESMLKQNRSDLEQKMQQVERGHHAANRYQQNDLPGQAIASDTSGGTLDLSE